MKQFLYCLCICLFASSCATLPSKNIPQELDLNTNDGMIVGTLSFKNQKPIFNSYLYFYTGNDIDRFYGQKSVRINPEQTIKMKFKPDFFDQEKAVYYFSIKEKEGKYQFTFLRVSSQTSYKHTLLDIPINIDFNLEKGKVKYFGEIYFDYSNKNIILSDQSLRDLPLLKNKFPKLNIVE
ncbi:hypothetical protein [Chishuiella changwenlii]|uniref:hypothetical protein n=1 Tax=Chishuiella changwenlii TaxID=1434701 RepID=UPI002FD8E3C1